MREHAYGRSPEEAISDVMKWMYQRGIVQVRGGNASIVDRENGIVYMSPTGLPRPLLKAEHIAVLDLQGAVIKGRPTSEWRMHLYLYRHQPHALAAVHAHPKALLTLTYRGQSLDPSLLSEAGIQVTCIGHVPYIRPGTEELALAVAREAARGCNVIVLERHGALVWSPHTIYHALDLLEAIEDLAWITLHLHL
ncbi:MAG: class II aldolase/adducin family protein [Desulfurococcales archaeon]|nr:class II aldolase/adducin family protein [Desulfurococcales archaeon]